MGRVQETRSHQGQEVAHPSHPVRRPQPLRPRRDGKTRLDLQERRALSRWWLNPGSVMNGPRVIDVSAALIFRAGQLLITQRHAKSHLGGLWEFPGGKREPDETFEACLIREIREELG